MMKKILSTALMAVTVSALALSGCAKKEETKPAAQQLQLLLQQQQLLQHQATTAVKISKSEWLPILAASTINPLTKAHGKA